jgi:GT2 family glycosyltransferase
VLPSVAIIVLNWNGRDLTLDCLRSLAGLEYDGPVLPIVVDNGSSDGSVGAIKAQFPAATLIDLEENLGYAEGNNVGLRHAMAQGVDYVCVLNNDTELDPACLRQLVAEAESAPDIGMVGPKMYFAEPPDMVFAAGSLIDWNRGILVQRGIWQRECEVGPLYHERAEDVDFIIGCCVLVKRVVIEAIGLLDARYFLNFEDVDWCTRARGAGFRVRYTPTAILWHKVSASLGLASPRNTYYMTRNSLLFFWSHLQGWPRLRTVARVVKRNIGHIAVWTFKEQYRHTCRDKRDINIRALRDAFLGRFGKMGPDVEEICQRS